MSRLLTLSLLATATLIPLAASAEDFYAGATFAHGGKLTFANPVNGKSTQGDAKTGLKLYGGYAFTDTLALEAGYAQYGTTTFDPTALGLAQAPTFKMRNLTLAGRYTYHINDDWSLFAKAGIASSRFTASDGAGERDSVTSTKPLLALGMAYNVSKAVALTVEIEHIGATDQPGLRVKQDALQLGVKVGF